MINHWILFLLSIFINRSNVVHSLQLYEADLQMTFDNLTSPNVYPKWIRPPIESSDPNKIEQGPFYINISIDLYNYAIVDEITSEYTFHLFIDMEWFDPRLKFPNEWQLDNDLILEGGQHHIDRIWIPTIFVPNNQDPGSFDYDHESANFIRLKPKTGYLWLRKRKMLRIYCDMDFHLYPFDKQKCELQLESSISTVNNLVLRWSKNQTFSTSESFRTIGFSLGSFQIRESEQKYNKNNKFSRVSLVFELARDWAHHIFLFYLPSGIITIASWASFWLEITSPPARVSIGVTTMLALVTTFKNTKSQLPNVSYWNALDIWNMVCIVFIFSSLMEFAMVNYIYNTEKRKKRNKKLQRKRQNTIRGNENQVNSNSNRKSFRRLSSSMESAYQTTVSTLSDLSSRLSDFSRRKSSSNESDLDSVFDKNVIDLNKRRRSSININIPKQMPNIKEEPTGRRSRRASAFSSAAVVLDYCTIKLTPEELANEIDRKSRRIFPLLFLLFNFLYWTLLQVQF